MTRYRKALLVRMGDGDRVALDRLADELQLPKAEIARRAVQALAGQYAIATADERDALNGIVETLRVVGTNLNQIARRLNTSGDVDAEMLGEVLARLIDLNAATRALVQQLTGQTRRRMIAHVSAASSSAGA